MFIDKLNINILSLPMDMLRMILAVYFRDIDDDNHKVVKLGTSYMIAYDNDEYILFHFDEEEQIKDVNVYKHIDDLINNPLLACYREIDF